MKKMLFGMIKGYVAQMVMQAFKPLKAEAALTSNKLDDASIAYAEKAVLEYINKF